MPILVSPGIATVEKDITTVVENVSTSAAGFAGVFRWGPCDERILISDEPTLAATFGKPSNLNGETWFTAANFLAYGNQLNVVRVLETGNSNTSLNGTSAYANTGSVGTAPAVRNTDDYANTVLDANVAYVAKYPGALGNSLKVSVCDSNSQFGSVVSVTDVGVTNATFTLAAGSNSAVMTIQAANAAVANSAGVNFAAKFIVGDKLQVGNTSIGKQTLRISAVGAPVVSGSNSTVTLSLSNPYTLVTTYSSNSVSRNWEFYNRVNRAPGTSQYLKNLNLTAGDELHVVIVDEDGLFTGTPNTILEVWEALSRATDAKTENNQGNYYKDILNADSNYIWYGQDRSGAASNTAVNLVSSTANTPYTFSFVGGADGATEATVPLGRVTGGYDMFNDPSQIDISILMQGKARGFTADSDTTPSSNAANYSTLANYIMSNITDKRKDCVVTISPAKADVMNGDKSTNVVQYLNNIAYASSYGIMDSGYKYQYDKYNDVYRWVPLNGDVAGTLASTDYNADPWYSPAGATRGVIKNVVKLAWNPSQAERDVIYPAGINPVIIKKSQGCILFGDKTLIGRSSAFDRINVRRLFIVLEKAISNAAQFALFEINDYFTRSRFVALVEPYLRDVQGRRGIYDFKVVCDETNNTPQVIDTNNFVGDIYLKPSRAINFITLSFIATPTGLSFTEVVGQV